MRTELIGLSILRRAGLSALASTLKADLDAVCDPVPHCSQLSDETLSFPWKALHWSGLLRRIRANHRVHPVVFSLLSPVFCVQTVSDLGRDLLSP